MSKQGIIHIIDKIIESVEIVQERTINTHSANEFVTSPAGMLLLDGVCMKLIAIGESVKSLDKQTNQQLLPSYPQIPWKDVMGMRDIIVHHYFEVDADIIFRTVKENIPPLLQTLKLMREDLSVSITP